MKRFLKYSVAVLIIILFGSCGTYEAVYLIPGTSMYVKLVSYFNETDGYIYINDREAFEKQDKPACIRVHRTDVSMTYIVFKRNADSVMYIRNASDNADIVDSGKFSIELVKLGDTTIFHPDSKIKHAFIANPPYYEIYIDGFLNSIYLLGEDSAGESTSVRIPELE